MLTELKNKLSSKTFLATTLFVFTISLILHFLFSSLGFNPTDDGFTLAYSQRIIDGQIPHKDFIIIRPFLSPLIHVPEIIFGASSAIWLSRFLVWMQLAAISWFSLLAILNFTNTRFKLFPKFLISLISLMLTAHNFPITAWHTLDGLFFISIGIYFVSREKENSKFIGYFLVALSYLTKQSFILVAPLTLIFLLDYKNLKYWLASLLPGIIYLLFLLFTGSLQEGFIQLTSQRSEFIYVTAGTYFNIYFGSGFILGLFSLLLRKKINVDDRIKSLLVFGITILVPLLFTLYTFITGKLIFDLSFFLFGLLSGMILLSIFYKNYNSYEKTGLIILLIAWSSGISLGYHFPVLFSGPIFIMLIILYDHNWKKLFRWEYSAAALSLITILLLIAFYHLRTNHIYRDHNSSKLIYKLDEVLPAGDNILTSKNTFQFLSELGEITDSLSRANKNYAVLPDLPAYWINAVQQNPLPIDWARDAELNSSELMKRMITSIKDLANETFIIVQKFHADSIAYKINPIENSYQVVNFVRNNFTKVIEGEYFDIYKNKD